MASPNLPPKFLLIKFIEPNVFTRKPSQVIINIILI